MFVFASCVNIQIAQQFSSQTVFRKHTFYYFLHQLFSSVRFSHQTSRSDFTLSTRITRIAQINLIVPLVTSELNFVSIDNNYIITAIYVRSKVRFVLTSQQFRNFRTETAYNLIGSINYDPFFCRSFLVCRNGLVT